MAKYKYCLLHIPTGTLIHSISFSKKSQGVAFLNSLPVRDGFFNPPENPAQELVMGLSKAARKTYLRQITEIKSKFIRMDAFMHPIPDDKSGYVRSHWDSRYKNMAKYSPTEFEIVSVKEARIPVPTMIGVHLD